MQDTTTIEIREDQRDAMQERKQHDRESYKSVLDRLLAEQDAQNDDAVDTDELARDVARQLDYAALSNQVADEVVGRLQR